MTAELIDWMADARVTALFCAILLSASQPLSGPRHFQGCRWPWMMDQAPPGPRQLHMGTNTTPLA